MARGRSNKGRERDDASIASLYNNNPQVYQQSLLDLQKRLFAPPDELPRRRALEPDQRRFHPAPKRLRPIAPNYRYASQTVIRGARNLQTRAPLGVRIPNYIAICIRRKVRKEVLHAKRKAGKGHKQPRRNEWSSIKC